MPVHERHDVGAPRRDRQPGDSRPGERRRTRSGRRSWSCASCRRCTRPSDRPPPRSSGRSPAATGSRSGRGCRRPSPPGPRSHPPRRPPYPVASLDSRRSSSGDSCAKSCGSVGFGHVQIRPQPGEVSFEDLVTDRQMRRQRDPTRAHAGGCRRRRRQRRDVNASAPTRTERFPMIIPPLTRPPRRVGELTRERRRASVSSLLGSAYRSFQVGALRRLLLTWVRKRSSQPSTPSHPSQRSPP